MEFPDLRGITIRLPPHIEQQLAEVLVAAKWVCVAAIAFLVIKALGRER